MFNYIIIWPTLGPTLMNEKLPSRNGHRPNIGWELCQHILSSISTSLPPSCTWCRHILISQQPLPPSPPPTHTLHQIHCINPLKPEFTIVIFIHNKPRIAVTILDLEWMNIIRILSGMGVKLKSIMWNAVTSPFWMTTRWKQAPDPYFIVFDRSCW